MKPTDLRVSHFIFVSICVFFCGVRRSIERSVRVAGGSCGGCELQVVASRRLQVVASCGGRGLQVESRLLRVYESNLRVESTKLPRVYVDSGVWQPCLEVVLSVSKHIYNPLLPSTEANYMAATKKMKEALWLKHLIGDLYCNVCDS